MTSECRDGEQLSRSGSLNFDSTGHLSVNPPYYPNPNTESWSASSTPRHHPVSPSSRPQPLTLPTNYMPAPSTPSRRRSTIIASQSTRARRITHAPQSSQRSPTSSRTQRRSPQKTPTKKKRRSPRSIEQKLTVIFDTLALDVQWSLGEFLYYLFRIRDDKQMDGKVHRTHRHAGIVSKFMRGDPNKATYGPAHILEAWLRTPDGRPQNPAEDAQMYTLNTPYLDIKVGRPAITSFAVQVTRDRLLHERRQAVKPTGGLHSSRTELARQSGQEFEDIEPAFIQNTIKLLQKHQGLTFALLVELATPNRRSGRSELIASQHYRPPELVVMQALSAVNFSHNKFANRLALATGMLYFATGVPNMVYRYGSRVGMSVSYSTTYVTLQKIGEEDRARLRRIGQDPSHSLILRLDNVQMFHKQREMRIGREDQVMMGTAGIACEAEKFNPEVISVEKRKAKLAEGLRKKLTVPQLLEMIDQKHLDLIGSLHWLKTLVTYVPQLTKFKGDVINLFRTEGAKFVIPPTRKTKAYPLATNDKHESLVTELKEALLDFFEQMGLTREGFQSRLCFVGGDGLTFEKILQLIDLLQFEFDSDFDRLDWIVAFLELWHTAWTDLSRIFETHWGDDLGRDPSTLGHSASKIKYKTPSNLKKVDYYSGHHLVNLVLDVRMMDCWRIYFGDAHDIFEEFEQREKVGNIPSLVELRKAAELLHRRYSSSRSYQRSMRPHALQNPYSVPLGDPWEKPTWMASYRDQTISSDERASSSISMPFVGDKALAQSQRFMMDAWMSREVAEAVPAGDIGRVWEIFKLWVFTFAGSSHTKYPHYLLEMICTLELESTPELKEFFLENWLVNPTGKPGKSMEGDLFVEHNNETLKDVPERQDSSWGGTFLRDVVSPNTFRIAKTKSAFVEGTGLKPATSSHPSPHTRPEFRTLSEVYREEGLHYFRPGREYNAGKRDVADLERGIERLRNGKLAQWISLTTSARGLSSNGEPSVLETRSDMEMENGNGMPASEELETDTDHHNEEVEPATMAANLQPLAWRYSMMVDGELFTEAKLDDLLNQEIEEEGNHWEDAQDYMDWQEVEPEPVPEVEFNDDLVEKD